MSVPALRVRAKRRSSIHHWKQRVEKGAVETELAAIAQCSADNPPQHITAAFIGGHHAVGQKKGRGTDVIGDHPVGRCELARRVEGSLHKLPDSLKEGHKKIGVVIGLDLLEYGGNALEPCAGVDGRPRQRVEFALSILIELHEDEVPDLDDVVALTVDELGAIRRERIGASVEVDLGTGATRSGLTHGPVVVLLAEAQDAIGRRTNFFPQSGGLVVIGVDG